MEKQIVLGARPKPATFDNPNDSEKNEKFDSEKNEEEVADFLEDL